MSNDAELLKNLPTSLPLAIGPYDATGPRHGLVIVDDVNGFATVGAGNLAPPVENAQVSQMVTETDRLARRASPTVSVDPSGHPGNHLLPPHRLRHPRPPGPNRSKIRAAGAPAAAPGEY